MSTTLNTTLNLHATTLRYFTLRTNGFGYFTLRTIPRGLESTSAEALIEVGADVSDGHERRNGRHLLPLPFPIDRRERKQVLDIDLAGFGIEKVDVDHGRLSPSLFDVGSSCLVDYPGSQTLLRLHAA